MVFTAPRPQKMSIHHIHTPTLISLFTSVQDNNKTTIAEVIGMTKLRYTVFS